VNLDEIVGYGGRKKDKLPAEVGRDGWFWWTRTEKLGVKLDEKSCFLWMRKSKLLVKLDEKSCFGGSY
jgi:hypothetical protein